VLQTDSDDQPTTFMAVPTVYAKLIAHFDDPTLFSDEQRRRAKQACRRMRLFVSGSAALPAPVMQRWREISGHTLLERYGMTECLMALSNPLLPSSDRLEGHVGMPLPSVRARIVDEATGEDVTSRTGGSGGGGGGGGSGGSDSFGTTVPGELRLKGDTVFLEYWRRPDATAESFDAEGWFKTGDVAERSLSAGTSAVCGPFKILGRRSVDIIKTGGYKVSALDVERVLLAHPQVAEAAVLAVGDDVLGEAVAAVVAFKRGTIGGGGGGGAVDDDEAEPTPSLEELRSWAAEDCAGYKFPRRMVVVDEIPKNAMGKVNKKDLQALFS
jgi:malonyl-CoA/methylmalonyl-CoA synthetase